MLEIYPNPPKNLTIKIPRTLAFYLNFQKIHFTVLLGTFLFNKMANVHHKFFNFKNGKNGIIGLRST